MSTNLKTISTCITVYVNKYALRETKQRANYHNPKRAKTISTYLWQELWIFISMSFHLFSTFDELDVQYDFLSTKFR